MSSNPKDARELLAFYVEAGADALLGEDPVDRMADEAAPPPAGGRPDSAAVRVGGNNQRAVSGRSPIPDRLQRSGPPPAGESKALVPPDAAIMAAREAARTAANLDELRALLESFEGCALRNTATQLVFADGNPQGRVMFVGEAPGHEEDISGRPFVGPSMQTLLGTKDGITRMRGRWQPFDTGTREIRAMATFHPAFLLRSPLQKRLSWRDFLAIKKALAQ